MILRVGLDHDIQKVRGYDVEGKCKGDILGCGMEGLWRVWFVQIIKLM